MRYGPHLLFLIVLVGFVYGRINMNPKYQTKVDISDPYLEPVTEVYPESTHPPVEPTEIEKPNDTKLFHKGEMITCIYQGIFSWSDGDEFVKAVPIKCKVTQVMDGVEDMREFHQSQYYQRFEVDCSKDVEAKSGGPGAGLVRGHFINLKKRWYSTEECYHFVTAD